MKHIKEVAMNKEEATKFQEKINESLDSAIQNGYELDDWSVEDIAEDIAEYDSEFENEDPKFLLPFILKWKLSRIPIKNAPASQENFGLTERQKAPASQENFGLTERAKQSMYFPDDCEHKHE